MQQILYAALIINSQQINIRISKDGYLLLFSYALTVDFVMPIFPASISWVSWLLIRNILKRFPKSILISIFEVTSSHLAIISLC